MSDPREYKKEAKTAPETTMDDLLLGRTKELAANGDSERNWPGVLIALLVILVVLSLILVSTLILSPGSMEPRVTKKKMSRDLKLSWTSNYSWTYREEIAFRNHLGGVTLYDPTTNSFRELVNNSTFRQLNAENFKVSADHDFMAFLSNVKTGYWPSYSANYHILEIATQVRFPVSAVDIEFSTRGPELQAFVFAPVGSSYAFVEANDLYYSPVGSSREVVRLTHNSSKWIYNGYPDWIYQREIFKNGESAIYFSDNATYLAYITFNDTRVGKVPLTIYSSDELYPTVEYLAYPKPGTENPDVSLWVVNLTKENYPTVQLKKPKDLEKDNAYLTSVKWASDNEIISVWTNRRQNLTLYNYCKWSESNDTFKCSVELINKIESQNNRVPVLSQPTNKWTLDVLTASPKLYNILFRDRVWIYYTSHPENRIGQQHLYKILKDPYVTRNEICVTCPLNHSNITEEWYKTNDSSLWQIAESPVKTSNCLHVSAQFAPLNKRGFYMVECLGPDVPSVHVFSSNEDVKIITLDANNEQRAKYEELAVPRLKLFPVELESGVEARVRLQLPPGLREHEDVTFPLILKMDSWPGDEFELKSATHTWRVDYPSYLASKRNYIIVDIDLSDEAVGAEAVLRRLAVIEYLKSTFNFIDKTRLGLLGWTGYGAYSALLTLELDFKSAFSCAAAVNGIYSWPHYNSFWTEKWLKTANVTDNYKGYEDADVSKRAGNLKEKKFLLVDSTTDPQIHYTHSMLLVKALVQEGVTFKHVTFPDEDAHFSKYPSSQSHLYSVLDSFWTDCLGDLDYFEWDVSYGSTRDLFNFDQS